MAGMVCLSSVVVLISIAWIAPVHSAPLFNNTQPCLVDTNQVYSEDFDFQKFAGVWHTTWRSRSHVKEESPPQTESRHFYLKGDGTATIVQTKKTGSGSCSMYETTLTAFGNASYIPYSGERFLLTIIDTDYHSAGLLMYCTRNFQDGVCADGDQYFEIITRDIQTVPEIEMRLLSKVDELCSRFQDMVYLAAECKDGSVVIDTIPVLPTFDLNKISGLSFAISQSNFTTAYSVTGYNIFLSNSRMVGWFTAEIGGGACSPPMSGIIKQSGTSGAHVYNRLGGLDSRLPWHQWKILYSDANYTLAYFCYSDFNGTCPSQAQEVRLSGRANVIDPAFQKKLYVLLQKVCMSPHNMKDIVHKTDCASVLVDSISPSIEECGRLMENKCTVEKLVTARYNRTTNKMDGIWYNVAAIHTVPGHMLHITSNQETGLDIVICTPIDNKGCKWNTRTRLVQLCDDKAEFMQHVIKADIEAAPIHQIRMAYIDEMTFFSYECSSESKQGVCEEGSLAFKVYSRLPMLSQEVLEMIADFLPFFCLEISDLQTANSFPTADTNSINKTHFPGLSECAVENMTPASKVNQTKILGYWYEIARSGFQKSVFRHFNSSSPPPVVVHFAQNPLGQLTFNYLAAVGDKCNLNLFTGKTLPRGEEEEGGLDGNYLARFLGKYLVFFKILYTDHDNIIIIYACENIYHDGRCQLPLLHVLGRKNEYNEELKTIMDKVAEKSCVHSDKWTRLEYKKNCTDFFINEQLKDGYSHDQPVNNGDDTRMRSLSSDAVAGQNK